MCAGGKAKKVLDGNDDDGDDGNDDDDASSWIPGYQPGCDAQAGTCRDAAENKRLHQGMYGTRRELRFHSLNPLRALTAIYLCL